MGRGHTRGLAFQPDLLSYVHLSLLEGFELPELASVWRWCSIRKLAQTDIYHERTREFLSAPPRLDADGSRRRGGVPGQRWRQQH